MDAITVGDAGGASIVTKVAADSSGFQRFSMQSTGEHAHLCFYGYEHDGTLRGQMLMKDISETFLRLHANAIDETYLDLGWQAADVDYLACHQVGARPHQQLARLTGVDVSRAPITYREYGNLTSATLPVVLSLHRPRPGDRVLIMGTGSGLTMSQSALVF